MQLLTVIKTTDSSDNANVNTFVGNKKLNIIQLYYLFIIQLVHVGFVVVWKLWFTNKRKRGRVHAAHYYSNQTNTGNTVSIFLSLSKQNKDGKFLFEYL